MGLAARDHGGRWKVPMSTLSLRAHERMRHSSEFRRVKDHGSRCRTRHFLINYRENGLICHRLGMVVQKRFWKAVERNRIKRCLREFFRHTKGFLPAPALDIAIIALPGAEKLQPQDIVIEISAVLARKEGHSS
jgi:ribonuclease P protein component